jgi:long-subunit fatty acid transport protein
MAGAVYDATTLEIASRQHKTGTLRYAPVGSFFGVAIAEPLTSSPNLRFGFYVGRPISWQTGTLNEEATLDPQTKFGLIGEATLTRMEPGVAMAGRMGEKFRVGGSLGMAVTTVDQSNDLSLRYVATDSASTTRRAFMSGGSSWHLVPRIGFQWDAGEHVRAGLVLASPGIAILGSTRLTYSSGSYSEQGYTDVSFHDPKAEFDYKIPFSAGFGLARLFSRGEVEAVVRYYGSTGEYDLFLPDGVATHVESSGGSLPVTTTSSVAPARNKWREVTNFALGGHYAFSEVVRLHFGFHADGSPVSDDATSIFRKIDLYGGTAGVSFTWKRIRGSLGLGYSAGSSEPIQALGAETETKLRVSTLRGAYAFTVAL